MIKNSLKALVLICSIAIQGQVGIGTSNPELSSIMDVSSNNKGFLVPRVAITGPADALTVPNPARGLIVFGTDTSFGEGLYINMGTPSSPDWNRLLAQKANNPVIEYTSLTLAPNVSLYAYANSASWTEIPELRQSLSVSAGASIKTTLTGTLNSQTTAQGVGKIVQGDVLVVVTPGMVFSSPPTSTTPRDSNCVIVNDGNQLSCTLNAAKSVTATSTNYVIQVYARRVNTANNQELALFTINPLYLNTLATK